MHYVRTSEISEIHFIFSSTGKTSTIDWHWVLGGRDRNPKKLSIIFSNRVSMIWFYRFLKIFAYRLINPNATCTFFKCNNFRSAVFGIGLLWYLMLFKLFSRTIAITLIERQFISGYI